jgi:hypothetical protein
MNCPMCWSTEVHEGCCGDNSFCRRCGHRFEAGTSEACPVKQEPGQLLPPCPRNRYKIEAELTDEQLWGG